MFEREVEWLEVIVREAGRLVLEVYETDFSFELKGVANPVTEADKRANDFLVRKIREAFPNDFVIAEESVASELNTVPKRCWYIDPLDGTKEFIAKNGEFSVMVGLAVEGQAKLGVVYQPVGEKLYIGGPEIGAWKIQHGERAPLQVTQTARTADLRLVTSRSHRDSSTDIIVKKLDITSERPSGSVGLKVGLIAEREADLYVHPSNRASAWDTCAPEAILHGAGGRFTDLAGKPIPYGLSDTQNHRGILACNSAAFDLVLPVVREVGQQIGLV